MPRTFATRRPRSSLTKAVVGLVLAVTVAGNPAAAESRVLAAAGQQPVLGSPEYVANGAGWGRYRPHLISNGGVPSGVVANIRWAHWGGPVATGHGMANIYRPAGNYYPPVRIPLRAKRLGTCPGHPERAYKVLLFRLPNWPGGPLGPWLKWSGSRNLCDYLTQDPRYAYPHRPRGICGDVGDFGEPRTVQDIMSYRLSCRHSRRAARAIGRREWSFACARSGCRRTVEGLKCRLDRVHDGENTGLDYPYPVQRVACKHRRATMSGWLVLPYD